MMELTHLSLFTGIGGMDIAGERAGFRTVGQCEWADYPTRVLEKHWPDVPRWRDIRTLTGDSFYERTGQRTVDVISGGFPCQPFSTAGKRLGKNDDRFLWPEMLRVISQLRPSWVIGENVAGLVSMAEPVGAPRMESKFSNRQSDQDLYEAVYIQQEHMLLDGILGDFEGIGYEVEAFIVPACGVDAQHQRYRTIIVGNAEHNGLFATAVGGGFANACDVGKKRTDAPVQSKGTGRSDNNENVADAVSDGCLRTGQESAERRNAAAVNFTLAEGCDVSDAQGKRRGETREYFKRSAERVACGGEILADADGEHGKRRLPARRGRDEFTDSHRDREWWPAEPDVGRVAYGVPDRVDRLKCLGNAVVPEQVYPFFAAIAEIERGLAG